MTKCHVFREGFRWVDNILVFVNELLDTYKNTKEKSIQSYPSPEFLNSLSFIKKFYPLPFGARGKFPKVTHENSSNLRHSEGNNNFIPKNLVIANTEVYPSKSSLTREDLCFV